MKKVMILLLCVLLLTACQNKEDTNIEQSTRTLNSIVGTWYQLESTDYIISWYFGEDNTYEVITDMDGELSEHYGNYVIEDTIVTMTDNYGKERGSYRVKYTDYGIKLMYAKEAGRPIELHENKQQLLESDPNYYTSTTYYKTIADKDGYVIEDGVLIQYVGDSKAITIPSNVKSIESGAIWGRKLEKVTFQGTLQTIQSSVFGPEPEINYIYLEDGVKEIENYAFQDIYLSELHIPASVTKIGEDIIGVEEGYIFDSIKIYVEKDSYAHQYFVKEGLEDRLVFEEPGNDLIRIIVAVVLVIGVMVAIAIIVKKKSKNANISNC